jgi:hypothetical protein
VDFPLAFAIATVVVVFLIGLVVIADRTLRLSRFFEDLGT